MGLLYPLQYKLSKFISVAVLVLSMCLQGTVNLHISGRCLRGSIHLGSFVGDGIFSCSESSDVVAKEISLWRVIGTLAETWLNMAHQS